MLVPLYTKLGQEAKDLFDLHYNISAVKIDVKNKIYPNFGVDFTGTCNTEDGKVTSALETKYDFTQYGFTAGAKWTTDNDLLTEVLASDKTLVDGLKVSFNTKISLVSGKKSGSVKAFLEGSSYNVNSDLDFEGGTPKLTTGALYRVRDMLLGSQVQLDVKTLQLQKQSLALGMCQDDLSLCATCEDFKDINVGLYKKVNGSLDKGVQLIWDKSHNVQLAFGCQQVIDASSLVKAKISSNGQLGMAYVYQYKPGIRLSISALLEVKNLMAGGHKLGFGLTFEG